MELYIPGSEPNAVLGVQKIAPHDLIPREAVATQVMVYPAPMARPKETFMLFGAPMGAQGNVINTGTNELVLPNYQQSWANIRKYPMLRLQ